MVLACNTAHLLLPELEARTSHSFVSLLTVTVDAVQGLGLDKVGLLASPTTIKTKLYQKRLELNGVQVITPTTLQLRVVETTIRAVIAGRDANESIHTLQNIVRHMKLQGAQSIILGCTELSVIFADHVDQSIIDPLTLVTAKLLGDNNDE